MKREIDDIEFEMKFYQGILDKKPDFVEALSALGDIYTKKGLYKQGLTVDRKLELLKPDDPIVLYNLSCSYSLLEDIENSFKSIKKAIDNGYDDFHYLKEDNDLVNLRADDQFKQFFKRIEKKKTELRR